MEIAVAMDSRFDMLPRISQSKLGTSPNQAAKSLPLETTSPEPIAYLRAFGSGGLGCPGLLESRGAADH
jgi:hypothetical protein